MLASSQESDKMEQALLNYSDAYYIFKKFGDERHRGICLANIGAIMMQKHDYTMAYASYKVSCEILYKIIHGDREEELDADKDDAIAINKFILACRQF